MTKNEATTIIREFTGYMTDERDSWIIMEDPMEKVAGLNEAIEAAARIISGGESDEDITALVAQVVEAQSNDDGGYQDVEVAIAELTNVSFWEIAESL